jgi:hypothetical protein
MPRLIPTRLVAACVLAFTLALCAAAVAVAKGPTTDLRVVDSAGKILAEKTVQGGVTSVPTSPQALCFGKGTGGSGKPATIKGTSALGVLGKAAQSTPALRPLSISDSFDIGLALCGIGGIDASSKGSWYLKVNHENPELGGEQVTVHSGDEILWALAAFPYPDELALTAPTKATAGKPFSVRVFAYDDKGKKKPAGGVKVTGASEPTGTDGRAMVTLNKATKLVARHGKDIPSNQAPVCVGGKCPRS